MSMPSEEMPCPNEVVDTTEDDVLENTKPNLISFSLSTTSSSFNTLPIHTKNSVPDGIIESDHVCEHDDMIEELVKAANCDVTKSNTEFIVEPFMTCEERNEGSFESSFDSERKHQKMIKYDENILRKTTNFQKSSNALSSRVSNIHNLKYSLSMDNLCEYSNCANENLNRIASQPLLAGSETNHHLKGFISKKIKHGYGHVESKVKNYIQLLKKNKAEMDDEKNVKEFPDLSHVTNPHCDDSSEVNQLQTEIQNLQECLEERDILLKEVQANHHLLLLQNAETLNRLDELRFSKGVPRQGNIKDYSGKDFYDLGHDVHDSHLSNNLPYYLNKFANVQSTHEICSNKSFTKVAQWCSSVSSQPQLENCDGTVNNCMNDKNKYCTSLTSPMKSSCSCFVEDVPMNKMSSVSSKLKQNQIDFGEEMSLTNNKRDVFSSENCDFLSSNVRECKSYSPAFESVDNLEMIHSSLNSVNVPPLDLIDSMESSHTCNSKTCVTLSTSDNACSSSTGIVNSKIVSENKHLCNVLVNDQKTFSSSTSYKSIYIKKDNAQEEFRNHFQDCLVMCYERNEELRNPVLTSSFEKKQNPDRYLTFEEIFLQQNDASTDYICRCERRISELEHFRISKNSGKSIFESENHPNQLSNIMQHLNCAIVSAKDLKKKTKAAQELLISLLNSSSDEG